MFFSLECLLRDARYKSIMNQIQGVFIKVMTLIMRCFFKVFLILTVGMILAVGSLYLYIQKNDVREYAAQLVLPYAPKLRFEGPVRLGIWPSLHFDAESVRYDTHKMKRARIQLPLIPFVKFALWRTPQKDLNVDIESLEVPGLEPVSASASCESKGELFDCKITAIMNEWKTKLDVSYLPKTTQFKGDVRYKNNTLHVVDGAIDNEALTFDGRVLLVGRNPVVIGTPRPINIHYANNVLTLKAPLVGLPQVELSNLKIKIKHHDKAADILELEVDAWHGHISTTGRVTWPHIALKGRATNIQLKEIKELQNYVESGLAACDWHITCNGEKALDSLSGNTHVKLNPASVKGIGLQHLKQEIKNIGAITPADIANLKEKLFKPAMMAVTCDMPIGWRDGVGTIQNGQVEAADIKATLSGRIDAKKADLKALVKGIPAWPSLPVKINGAWDNLSYTPDWSVFLKAIVSDMRTKTEKEIKKIVESKLGDVHVGLSQSLQKEAGKLLSGLLG